MPKNKSTVSILVFFAFILTINCQSPHYINYDTNDGLPTSQTYDIFEDDFGYMWFTSDRGIIRYDGYDFKTFTTENGLASLVNFDFYRESGTTFWLNGYNGKLTFWDGKNFIPFKFNDKLKQLSQGKSWFNIINISHTKIFFTSDSPYHPPNQFYSIDKNNGRLATLAFYPAIYNYKKISDRVRYRSTQKTIKKKPIPVYVLGQAEDENGNIWKLTRGGLEHYKKDDSSLNLNIYFKGIPISSMYKNKNGNYWFTTLNTGLFYVPSFEISKINALSNQKNVFEKLRDFDDFFIAKSTINGKFLFYKNTTNYFYSEINDNQKIKKGLNTFFKDEKHKLNNIDYKLIGNKLKLSSQSYLSYSDELLIIKDYKKNISRKTLESQSKIICALKDSTQILWIGTLDGLFKVDLNKSPLNIVPSNLSNIDSTTTRINDLLLDKNNLWIATFSKGIYYKSNKISKIKHESLKGKIIESLYKENDSIIWVGTNKGLLKMKYHLVNEVPKIQQVSSLTSQEGLSGNIINDIIKLKGSLHVSTNKGINYFDPCIQLNASIKPKLHLDHLTVNGNITNEIIEAQTYNHNQNNIKISYTGISLNKPLHPDYFYRYRLNNQKWSFTNNRSIEYHSLPPENYIFEIQCKNNDGVWSNLESVKFSIQPHLFQRLEVRIAFFVILIIIFGLSIRYKLRSTKTAFTKEIRFKEAQLATLRNQMNPHFVYNSLNTLQSFIVEGDVKEANQYLGDFSSLMRKSLEFSARERISIAEEVHFIEAYLKLEKHRFINKFNYEVVTEINLSKSELFIPSLLVQPLVENAVKHAFKNNLKDEFGFIQVKYLQKNTDRIIIQISDDGCGFDLNKINLKTSEHSSMGIQIVKQRIEIQNQKDKKSKSSIQFIKQPKGTLIELNLPIIIA